MKLKISILFFVLAALLVVGILKRDVLFGKPVPAAEENTPKEFTKDAVFGFLRNSKFVSYSDQPVLLDQALIDSADIITIHFWASWCSPCVNEVPELIDFAHRVSAKNSQNLKTMFIAVSLDETTDELNKFLKSFPEFNKDPFIRIWDKDKSFSKMVDADRLPMTVILNKNIPEPRVVRGVVEWKSVNF
jgi:thiol-disulfide isomerase/thioredoxin